MASASSVANCGVESFTLTSFLMALEQTDGHTNAMCFNTVP